MSNRSFLPLSIASPRGSRNATSGSGSCGSLRVWCLVYRLPGSRRKRRGTNEATEAISATNHLQPHHWKEVLLGESSWARHICNIAATVSAAELSEKVDVIVLQRWQFCHISLPHAPGVVLYLRRCNFKFNFQSIAAYQGMLRRSVVTHRTCKHTSAHANVRGSVRSVRYIQHH